MAPKSSEIKLRLLIETVDKASQGIDRVTKKLGGFNKETEKSITLTKSLTQASLALTAVAAALSAAFVFPIKRAADFEQSMSRVKAVTDGAKESFDLLNEKASELGGTSEFTAKQVADGMAFLGRAGFEAAEVLEAMSDVVDLAAAGQIDLSRAADISSNVLQGMQLPVSELNRVMDTLAIVATGANTNILQLGEALKFAAPVATAAGISVEETAAALGVLSNNGLQASLAGTGLRIVIASLIKPSKQARDALAALGVEVAKSPDGQLDLIETLKRLRDANIDAASAFAIFQRRGASAALALSKQVDEFENLIEKAEQGAGALNEMATIMRDNLNFAIVKATSALDRLARAFGNTLLVPLKRAFLALAAFSDSVAVFIENNQALAKFILITIGVLALFTSALAALGLVMLGLPSILSVIGLGFAGITGILNVGIVAIGKYIAELVFLGTRIGIVKTAHIALLGVLRVVQGAITSLFTAAALNPWGAAAIAVSVAIAAYIALGTNAKTASQRIKEAARNAEDDAKKYQTLADAVNNLQEAFNELEPGTTKSVEAQNKLRESTAKLAKDVDKQIDDLENLQQHTNFLTEDQKKLLTAARALKNQIDLLGGGFFDSGEKAKEFNRILRLTALEKARDQVRQLITDLDDFIVEDRKISIDTELKELSQEDISTVRGQAKNIIKELERVGLVGAEATDANKAALEEIIATLVESLAVGEALTEKFIELGIASKEATDAEDVTLFTLEFLKQKVVLEDVRKELEKINKLKGDKTGEDVTDALTQAQKKETKAITETKKALEALAADRISVAKKSGEEAIEEQIKLESRGVKEKEAADKEILKIEADTQSKILKIREETLRQSKGLFEANSPQLKAFSDAFKKTFEESTKAKEAFDDATAKSAAETAKKIAESQAEAAENIEDSFSSILESMASGAKSALDKLETDRVRGIKKVEDAENSLQEIRRSNLEFTSSFEDKFFSKSFANIRKSRRLSVEASRLILEASRGASPEFLENADENIADLKSIRSEIVGLFDAGAISANNARGRIAGINKAIEQIAVTRKRALQEQVEDITKNILDVEVLIKRVSDLSTNLRINFSEESFNAFKAQVDILNKELSGLDAGIDPEELKQLEEEIFDFFVGAKLNELNITVTEQELNKLFFDMQAEINKKPPLKIPVEAVQQNRFGGLVQRFADGGKVIKQVAMAAGGKLAGYGGGDRIHAALEAGEFVLRKEVVRGNEAFLNAWNSMRGRMDGFRQKFQTGGLVQGGGPTTNLRISINGQAPVQLQGPANEVSRLTRILRREGMVTI